MVPPLCTKAEDMLNIASSVKSLTFDDREWLLSDREHTRGACGMGYGEVIVNEVSAL